MTPKPPARTAGGVCGLADGLGRPNILATRTGPWFSIGSGGQGDRDSTHQHRCRRMLEKIRPRVSSDLDRRGAVREIRGRQFEPVHRDADWQVRLRPCARLPVRLQNQVAAQTSLKTNRQQKAKRMKSRAETCSLFSNQMFPARGMLLPQHKRAQEVLRCHAFRGRRY